MIDRASARGAAANTSSEISCVLAAMVPPERSHSTSDRTPAWATSMTQDRWSAGSARNQGSVSSIRATAALASLPGVPLDAAQGGGQRRLRRTAGSRHAGHASQPVTVAQRGTASACQDFAGRAAAIAVARRD